MHKFILNFNYIFFPLFFKRKKIYISYIIFENRRLDMSDLSICLPM